jgi:dihydroflavonol-4-reductase
MVLITGASGLVGSHLLFEIIQSTKVEVKAMYRNPIKKEEVLKIFKHYAPEDYLILYNRIIWIQGDVLDVCFLDEHFKGISTVYHCAAKVSFKQSDFQTLMNINRVGTANVVNACLDHGVEVLAYVSSTSALGSKEGEVVTEETRWEKMATTSGYSISKYSAEKEVWRGREEGLNVIVVNPCLIIGAGNWNESSLTILRAVDRGLSFYTTGANAIVDARVVAHVMVKLVAKHIYNERYLLIGSNISFLHLFNSIAIRLGKKQPNRKVNKMLMGVAWRFASFIAWISGKTSSITKESARSAFNTTVYSNAKIQSVFPELLCYSIEETIDNAVRGRII